MRVLGCLALIGLLLPALPALADLSEADGWISIFARAVGWVVRFRAQGYTLRLQRDRQDGRGHYYMFTNATSGLTVSFYIKPADKCATAEACRETYWTTRHPSMANAQGVRRFERNGFALLEFQVEYQLPSLQGQTVTQGHVSGHLVRDGYWVDMHLSMMPYTPGDRQTFLDFVDAFQVAPKGQ
jgi:hypothetical protein